MRIRLHRDRRSDGAGSGGGGCAGLVGGWAEHALTIASFTARRLDQVSPEAAAVLPVAGATAYDAMNRFDLVRWHPGGLRRRCRGPGRGGRTRRGRRHPRHGGRRCSADSGGTARRSVPADVAGRQAVGARAGGFELVGDRSTAVLAELLDWFRQADWIRMSLTSDRCPTRGPLWSSSSRATRRERLF
jgi:hypothetical protein